MGWEKKKKNLGRIQYTFLESVYFLFDKAGNTGEEKKDLQAGYQCVAEKTRCGG